MKRGAVLCGLAFVCLAVPSLADATTFCVNPVSGQTCSGTSEPDLQSALTAASTSPNNTQRNTVIVGNPGTPPVSGYTYATASPTTNPVDIVGAGQGTTTLTFTGGSSSTVLAVAGDGSSVSNLSIVLPASAGGTGLALLGATARGVRVTSPGPQAAAVLTGAALLHGSSPSAPLPAFTQSSVSYPTSGSGSQELVVAEVGALVQDDNLVGHDATGLVFGTSVGYPNSSTLRRVSLVDETGTGSAVGLVVEGQTVSADNLTEALPGAGSGTAAGAVVEASGGSNSTLNLNHASLYGNADTASSPGSLGVLSSGSSGLAATTNVRNSIIRNFFYGTERTASGSGSSANVRYDYSDYDVVHHIDSNSGGATGTTTRGVGDLDDADPGWVNPVAGDFRLSAGSPVINAGDPAPLNPAVESTTDILGKPRISGGRRDMGAVEFQFPAPTLASSGTFSPKSGAVSLAATCNEPSSDACSFTVTLTGTVTKVTHKHGHKHKKKVKVTVVLTGMAGGSSSGTLTGKFSKSALKAIGKAKTLKLNLSGSATDHGGTVFPLSEPVKLKRLKKHHH